MSQIIDTLEAVLTDLRDAGVRATMDPRNVTPPCVLLVPPQVDLDILCGGGDCTFVALALAPPPANLDAWKALDALAEKVSDVIPVERIRATQYGVDDTGALPALELRWTKALSWP